VAEFKRVLLVDANNVFVRGLHAAFRGGGGPELSAGGVPTAPLLFFINSLARHVRIEQPDSVMVCWDGGRSVHRQALSSVYKAHRPVGDHNSEYFDYAYRFLSLAGIPQLTLAGYEADDLIGAYVQLAEPMQIETVIVSDDHDLRQLISRSSVEQAKVSATSAEDRWTYDKVVEEMGLQPHQIPYLMALTGDSGDGVIGLKGIGPKKGLKMLQANHFNFNKLLMTLNLEDRAIVELAYALVDLRHPSQALLSAVPPLRPFAPTLPDWPFYDRLRSFLERYEMSSVLRRLEEGRLWTG
jgi:DNA polymerase-1